MTLLRTLWDRLGAWVALVAGVLCLIFGYVGVRGTAYVAEQMPYIISGGILGLFLLGVGATMWLSADLRDQWRALLDIRDELRAGATPSSAMGPGAAAFGPAAVAATTEADTVAGPGQGRRRSSSSTT
jgi:amino acid transporter